MLQYVAGVEWIDLGVHKLKGLSTGERIYQVNTQALSGRTQYHEAIGMGTLGLYEGDEGKALTSGPQQPKDLPKIARATAGKVLKTTPSAAAASVGDGRSSAPSFTEQQNDQAANGAGAKKPLLDLVPSDPAVEVRSPPDLSRMNSIPE
jgi:hypothetical protein